MSRRIDVELTSQSDDGTWTWRAAGAKQPKGTLDGALLYSGAAVGDVCRAEADFEIDGIFITAVMPAKGRSGRPDDERIELLGSTTEFQGVTTQLAKKGRSGKKKDGRRRDDGKKNRAKGAGRDRDGKGRKASRDDKPRKPKADAPAKPKPKKLKPGRAHRKALIEGLPEEQRVIAEQVSRGGMAAVRKEIEEQNRRAEEEGTDAVRADALLALAESLVPQIKVAEWRDRADAALKSIADVDVRDLRAVIVAAEDFARDDESRALAEEIRSGLNQRVESDQMKWQDEIREALKEERVVRALRLSSRPPKAGSPLPPDIAESLASQANQALGGDVSQQRIGIVLEAVAFSPIRPYVAIAHIPPDPGKELLEVVTKVSDRIPDIAKQFGIEPIEKGRGKRRPKNQKRAEKQEKSSETEPGAPSGESAVEKSVDAATQDLEPATVEETGMSSEPEPVAPVEVNDAGVDAEEDEAMQLHDDESLDEDPSDAEPKETE